jgi:hypothetical protein
VTPAAQPPSLAPVAVEAGRAASEAPSTPGSTMHGMVQAQVAQWEAQGAPRTDMALVTSAATEDVAPVRELQARLHALQMATHDRE